MKVDKAINVFLYVMGMAFNLSLMVVLGFLVYFAFDWGFNQGSEFAEYMVYVGPDLEIEFVIEEDTSAAIVAQRLEELGIIQNRWLFQFELFIRGNIREYLAGTYTLNLNMTNADIHRTLLAQPMQQAPDLSITVREGWTIRDMAEYFERREFFTAEEFIYVAENGHFPFIFLRDVPNRPNRLEGYLFPDTYRIPVNPRPEDIIIRMLNRFDAIFTESFHGRAEELGLSIDDVVIMASIIERETRLESERPLVSQVIHSRLEQNMLLQMCSTVKYVMDDPPIRLLYVHLEIDSPYNTYRHLGLPIGPISNPSAAAIQAALWPAETDYLFFVLRDEITGSHFFSRTYEEHSAAQARYAQQASS